MSIRRRLLAWLLSAGLAVGLVAAAVVFVQAREEANGFFDYQLRQVALTLRDRPFLPSWLDEALREEESPDMVIAVWSPDGRRVYDSHPALELPAPTATGFADLRTGQGRWRAFTLWHQGRTIVVAQHQLARERLALAAAGRTLLPFALLLPILGLLLWRVVGHEMKVLSRTAADVAARTPSSLAPIERGSVPDEVAPLVDSINGLLARLGGALVRQREFVADAAHELRTPLTALRLQLQLAERATDPAEREQAHARLREGIARATRLVEQLLALARAEPDAATPRMPIDLADVARTIGAAHEASARGRGLELVVETGDSVHVLAHAGAMETLAETLLDNAIRYTPAGRAVLRVSRHGSRALLEVEDTGPGIPVGERERVFDRFHRGPDAPEGGSGLGLAIARRIAEAHGGTIHLEDRIGGSGLRVRVELPLSPA